MNACIRLCINNFEMITEFEIHWFLKTRRGKDNIIWKILLIYTYTKLERSSRKHNICTCSYITQRMRMLLFGNLYYRHYLFYNYYLGRYYIKPCLLRRALWILLCRFIVVPYSYIYLEASAHYTTTIYRVFHARQDFNVKREMPISKGVNKLIDVHVFW